MFIGSVVGGSVHPIDRGEHGLQSGAHPTFGDPERDQFELTTKAFGGGPRIGEQGDLGQNQLEVLEHAPHRGVIRRRRIEQEPGVGEELAPPHPDRLIDAGLSRVDLDEREKGLDIGEVAGRGEPNRGARRLRTPDLGSGRRGHG